MAATNKQVIYDLIVKTQGTTDLQKLEAELTKFTQQTERAKGAANNFKAPVEGMGKSVGEFKSRLGNIGYQLQDFVVQVGNGTSVTRSLAQQLPQLLSGFGGIGIAAGTAAALIVPLAGALLSIGNNTKSLSQASGEIKTAFDGWKSASEALSAELDKLRTKSVDTGQAIRAALVGDIKLAKDQMLGSFKELTASIGNDFKQFQGIFQSTDNVLKRLSPSIVSAIGGVTKLGREFRAVTPEAKGLVNTLAGFENLGASTSELEAIATATEKVNRAAQSKDPLAYAQALTELRNQTQALLEKLGVAPGIIASIVGPMNAAADAARNMAGGVNAASVAMNNFLQVYAKYQSAGTALPSSYGMNFTPTIRGIETTTAKMERLSVVQKQVQTDMSQFWNDANYKAQENARTLANQNIPKLEQLKIKYNELKQAQKTLGANATADEQRNLNDALAETSAEIDKLTNGTGGGKGGGGKKGGGGGGLKKAADDMKKLGDASKKAGEDLKKAKAGAEEFAKGLQQIAESAAQGVVDALFAVAEGSQSAQQAFTELAKSMLKQIANLVVQLLVLKPLMGMFGGGLGGIGLFGGGASAATLSARNAAALMSVPKSATIGNYQGYGPSPSTMQAFRSSSIIQSAAANHNAPMNVTINNQSGAQVKTRRDENTLTIDIIEEVVADRITRGGNRIDSAMQRAFGARRVGY